MAEYTANYNLEKQQGNEYISIEGMNSNFDKIDSVLGNTSKFGKASGTSIAITLTDVILEDGVSKTFIVASNNSGAATTINGKPLYKPSTTVSPKLIAGKAVTVWYDTTGDCFFIKASAEGTASVGDVLAGKTFSNDNDTGLTGTVPNNGAVVITPGTVNQSIATGYHNGSGYVAGDADLISTNIKAGANIFGVAGNSNVVDTSAGDASASNILSGKKAYVDGALVTGNISDYSESHQLSTDFQKFNVQNRVYLRPPKGYYDGDQSYVYMDDANLVPTNIVSGKSIFGIVGSVYSGRKSASGIVTASVSSQKLAFSYTENHGTLSSTYITVSGLTFTPSEIHIIESDSRFGDNIPFTIYSKKQSYYPDGVIIISQSAVYNTGTGTVRRFIVDGTNAYVTSTGFRLPTVYGDWNYYWVAIE